MPRNSALFGASLTAGVVAAASLVAIATGSQAAAADTAYGVSYATATDSGSWKTGIVQDTDGIFTATATVAGGTSVVNFAMPVLGVAGITVTTSCLNGAPQVAVTGGNSSRTYKKPVTISAAAFTGNPDVVGTVSLLSGGKPTVGAYYDLTSTGLGSYIKLGGVTCAAAPPPSSSSTSPTSSSSSSTSPTSSTSSSPTSSTSSSPTSSPSSTSSSPTSSPTSTPPSPTSTPPSPTSTPPSPTSTGTPSTSPSGTQSPTSSASPTTSTSPTATEPPTPQPTITTGLPVTG